MGSSLCCVLCERCREQQAANPEPSETKPILQSPRNTWTFLDTQPPTPALKVPKKGSKELLQEQQASADALEENGDACCAAEGWEPAWNPMDFFAAPADEEDEGEVEGLSQQEEVGKAEEEMKAAAGAAVGALGAEEEQAGTEGAPCAGLTLQEGNIPSLMELSSEAEAGPEPPADTLGALVHMGLSLCAVQVTGPEPMEGTHRAGAAGPSPRAAQRAELSYLVEAMSLLTLQSPSEAIAKGVAELYCSSAESWQPLCLQWGSLEAPGQPLELLKEDMQGTVPPGSCAGLTGLGEILQQAQDDGAQCELGQEGMQGPVPPAQPVGSSAGLTGLGEILQQPQDGALCELGQQGNSGCTPGAKAELQDGIVQLPEEPAASAPVQQEAELPLVPPSLPRVLGSSGEMEAEKVEA
ncbi:uncharacterized protein LOC135457429 isoform X2 [Zonotrichia leucophrys gambelii]|uniref:uncharacterized protein LOC135457429 isoform X2 n=1 Tax=Zonotrichia leucophrys gambelii TaxID=257770 RepID=UPI00313FFF35